MNQPTIPTRQQRIAARQAELTALEVALMQSGNTLATERKRHADLARQYNNKIAFIGHLIAD